MVYRPAESVKVRRAPGRTMTSAPGMGKLAESVTMPVTLPPRGSWHPAHWGAAGAVTSSTREGRTTEALIGMLGQYPIYGMRFGPKCL
jgi:hypothetical protein